MAKEEAYESLKEAWSEFCEACLADKSQPGVYRGQNISILAMGDFLIEHIEETVDLDDDVDEEESRDGQTSDSKRDPFE
jgi:hypothetical protein